MSTHERYDYLRLMQQRYLRADRKERGKGLIRLMRSDLRRTPPHHLQGTTDAGLLN